jgi:hypothetical protein
MRALSSVVIPEASPSDAWPRQLRSVCDDPHVARELARGSPLLAHQPERLAAELRRYGGLVFGTVALRSGAAAPVVRCP